MDLVYSKALFPDRSLCLRSLYGKELHADYYHRRYGVEDDDHRDRPPARSEEELRKLRLSWNIGVGDYPREMLRQRAGTAAARLLGPPAAVPFHSRKASPADPVGANRGLYPVHARIGLTSRPSISYQRKLILERIGGDPRFLVGEVSQARYNSETAHSRIVLSPFGWGELCLRDFEAVRSGALLMKPDMGHLETWPDIFRPDETYAPISWDAEDLQAQTDRYLGDEAARAMLIRDTRRMVYLSVMKSPRLTDKEISGYAKSRNINEEVIRMIASDRDWTKNYNVKLSLVSNPKCPPNTAVNFLRVLTTKDIKNISGSRDVPGYIARQAKQILDNREQGKRN